MSFEIVEMDKKYLGNTLEIYQWYVRNSTATFQTHEPTLSEMVGLLFFTEEKYGSFALLENGICVGYGIITQFKAREAFDRTAEITIYLAESATGKGYGGLVVAHLEGFARNHNLHMLVALVSGENTASFKLFERSGYSKCAHFHDAGNKFNRWIDLVCYEKKL